MQKTEVSRQVIKETVLTRTKLKEVIKKAKKKVAQCF